MNRTMIYKLTIVLTVLVAFSGIVSHFLNRRAQQMDGQPPAISQKSRSFPSKSFSTRRELPVLADEVPTHPDDESAYPPKVSREKIEEYLKLHNRDAASLLAAFHASGDGENAAHINYLTEAATNFANDPHV